MKKSSCFVVVLLLSLAIFSSLHITAYAEPGEPSSNISSAEPASGETSDSKQSKNETKNNAGSDFSIPDNIGPKIPQQEENSPIFGILSWAVVVISLTIALIIILSNARNGNNSTVKRNRYHKKQTPQRKLLSEKYYRKK